MTEQDLENIDWNLVLLCMELWEDFKGRAAYDLVMPEVLDIARDWTKAHIVSNYNAGKFADPNNVRKAKICVKRTASFCNKYVDDRMLNGDVDLNKITKEDYKRAFREMQGAADPGVSPYSMASTGDDGRDPQGKFHGLLCQSE